MRDDARKNSGNGLYERRWERFSLSRQGTLLTVGPGLTFPTTRSCQLIDISQGNATFTVTTAIGLPSHYYLSVVGIDVRIGCAEVHRSGNRIAVQFIKEIDARLLHAIVRSDYFTNGAPASNTEPVRPYMTAMGKAALGLALR